MTRATSIERQPYWTPEAKKALVDGSLEDSDVQRLVRQEKHGITAAVDTLMRTDEKLERILGVVDPADAPEEQTPIQAIQESLDCIKELLTVMVRNQERILAATGSGSSSRRTG